MNLVVMIPAYNEEKTIGRVIRQIPKKIKGVSKVKVLVVDDGSTDNTVKVAKKFGVNKVVSHKQNLGLGIAFRTGLDTALEMGADIIVNIDADNQYDAKEIPELIKPILNGNADIVLGSRFKGWIEDMPFVKRIGNKTFSWLVRRLSSLPISDAQTGFRALTRSAVLAINLFSNYTYTQEMIIQAAYKNLKIVEVPCSFRKREGKSRLISTVGRYTKNCIAIVLRTYRDYKPLQLFGLIGGLIFVSGLTSGSYVLYHWLTTGLVSPHIPLAILTAILLIFGFQIIVFGLIADMVGSQRKLIERIFYEIKKENYGKKK